MAHSPSGKYQSNEDLLIAAGYIGTTVGIFAGPVVSAVTYPFAAGATIGLAAGAAISAAVWGEEGLEDFALFYTGDGNYLTSDLHGSGYFNVPQNVATIVEESPLFSPLYWEKKIKEPESTPFSFADLGRHIRL